MMEITWQEVNNTMHAMGIKKLPAGSDAIFPYQAMAVLLQMQLRGTQNSKHKKYQSKRKKRKGGY